MSVDERLRSALREQAESFLPPVESALDTVRARGGRRRSATVALGAAAAAAVALGGAWAVSELPVGDVPPAAQTPTAPATTTGPAPQEASPLRGRITADVAEPAALAGTWTLTLNGNGTMDVEPPAGYEGDVSTALFTASSTSLRTSLFQESLCRDDGTGFYSWLRVGERIELHEVSDTCADRSTFFGSATWVVSTEPGRRD